MTYAAVSDFPACDGRRTSWKALPYIVLGVFALGFGGVAGVWMAPADDLGVDEAAVESAGIGATSIAETRVKASVAESRVAKTVAAPAPRARYPYVALFFDPAYSNGSEPVVFSQDGPVAPDYPLSAPASRARAPAVAILQTKTPDPDKVLSMSTMSQTVPLPRSRPADLRSPSSDGPELAQQTKPSVVASMTPDKRSLLQKIFGAPEPGPTLAYASADGGVLSDGQSITSGKMPALDQQTAVYDISARLVYLPDGRKLEAHSGLGSLLDDPRHVHVRMRGATPPAVYELTMREQLFHGVPALRLNPIGSEVFGRTGLLAHTYMLGPNGDSNGCVSFKNYDEFLQAYRAGKVKRLAVVASLKS
jgi:type VI secretion system (T6SS) effector TldE1-like protein